MLVAAANTTFEEQPLIAGTKQSRQADKAGRLTRQAGWQGSRACLLCFVPATSTPCFLQTNILTREQPNFGSDTFTNLNFGGKHRMSIFKAYEHSAETVNY
jgi:hypothetical protein